VENNTESKKRICLDTDTIDSIFDISEYLFPMANIFLGSLNASWGLVGVVQDITNRIQHQDINAPIQYSYAISLAIGTIVAIYGYKGFKYKSEFQIRQLNSDN